MRVGFWLAIAAVGCGLGSTVSNVCAGDWPQILGPRRNGVAENERLIDTLPASGLARVWEHEVGSAFAGPAVVAGRLYLFSRHGDEEVLEARETAKGTVVWRAKFPTAYQPTINPEGGPLCVPVVTDDKVIVFGADGNLHCVGREKGQPLWSRDTKKDFQAPRGYFGAGSSPLVLDGRVVVNVGGRSNAGVVAFDLKTGDTVWQKGNDLASYASPIVTTTDGVVTVIAITRLHVVGLDPVTGQERFRFPFGDRGPTVNAANPLVVKQHLFVTASYGIGAVSAKLTKQSAEQVWANDDTLSSQYSTPVSDGTLVFGIHGRQDVGSASLRCLDPMAGKVRWSENDFGTASLILADGKLLLLKTDGEFVLAKAQADRFVSLGRSRLFTDTVRPLPALSNGYLYARDTKHLRCFNLAKTQP